MDDSRLFWKSCVNTAKKHSLQWLIILLLAGFMLNGFMPNRSHQETAPASDSVADGWQFASPREFVPAKVYQGIGSLVVIPETASETPALMESAETPAGE